MATGFIITYFLIDLKLLLAISYFDYTLFFIEFVEFLNNFIARFAIKDAVTVFLGRGYHYPPIFSN